MISRLGIPIIQAPMLGATTETIAIAVSEAGGMGSFAAAGSNPDQIRNSVATINAATSAPYAVNIFVLDPVDPDPSVVRAAMELVAPWRERYGLPPQSIPNTWAQDTAAQVDAIIEAAPPAASFTFGCLPADQVARLKAANIFVIGTATTVAEAKAWQAAGADAICAQGIEAGGHRGTFLSDIHGSAIGTMSLVRTIRAAVDLPLIAAGGITDGEGIAAALMLGADAVQIGTAYLLSDEAITPAPQREAILDAPDDPTRLTRAISGRYARGIDNEFMRAMKPIEDSIAPYPIQNALTAELRAAAIKANSTDVMSLWCGQSVKLARAGKAADITRDLWKQAQVIMRARTTRYGGSPGASLAYRRGSMNHRRMPRTYQGEDGGEGEG
jgi:nitronate monooxygenase